MHRSLPEEKVDLKEWAAEPETREGGEPLMSACDCHIWLPCLDRNMLVHCCLLFGAAMLYRRRLMVSIDLSPKIDNDDRPR
jgi:hypothetical protein